MAALIFSNLAPDNQERVRCFASLPFHGLLKCSRQQVESRWMDEMAELLAAEGALAIVAEMGSTVCGFAICTPLPWESALLGKSMWAIKHIGVDSGSMERHSVSARLIAEINHRLAARGADFLLCKTSASDPGVIHALESNGFLLMDTLLDFVCDCRIACAQKNPPPPLPEGFVLRLATSADVEPLVETAHASFAEHIGRFHADPRIGCASATKVYEAWVRSCANGWTDWVFVATHGNRIAGYSAWKKPSALNARHGLCLGHYNIGAVHPDFFGRGIFTALTRAGMDKLSGSTDWIEGPTHIENRAVQRGYLRLGWQIAGAQHSFHKWLKP